MRFNVVTAVFAILLGVFQMASAASASVYVSGKVLITETRAPAADATLSLYKLDDPTTPVSVNQTLVNGSYLLKAPAAGKYRLTVEGSLFSALEKTIDIPATGLSGEVLQVNHLPFVGLQLQAPSGKPVRGGSAELWLLLSWPDGTPYNADWGNSGAPGTGIPMELTRPVGPDGRVEITLASGGQPGNVGFLGPGGRMQMSLPETSLQGITAVTARVRIPGVGCGQVQFDHWPTQVTPLHLQTGATLQGVALDYNGKPLSGATITVEPVTAIVRGRFRQADDSITAGPDGRFQVPTLIPGEYLVRAHGPNGSPSVNKVEVKAPITTVTLRPGGFTPGLPVIRRQ